MREKRLRALAIAVGLCIVLAFPVVVSADDPDFVFTLYPTGDPSIDTANLQAVFDAAVLAGSGSTVQLVEGVYKISHTIYVIGFDGCFRGAGKGDTVIQIVDGFSPHAIWPEVFSFEMATPDDVTTIRVEDMSVHVIGSSANGDPLDVFTVSGAYTGLPDPEPSYLSVFFERVEIVGERGVYPGGPGVWDSDSNVMNGLWILGEFIGPGHRKPIIGTYSVTNCDFMDIWYGIVITSPTDSTVIVSHNKAEDVGLGLGEITAASNTQGVIENNYISSERLGMGIYHGVFSWWYGAPQPEPSCIKVSGNTFHLVDVDLYDAIHVWKYPSWSGESSELNVEISHNTIYAPGTADGIVLIDYSNFIFGEKSLNAIVSHNDIVLENSVYGGMYVYAVDKAVIANNLISGVGDYGILTWLCEGVMLLGNNLQGFEPIIPGWSVPIALLECSYCAVVGGPTKTNVWDYMGYENVLVGVNNMQGNAPGQDIANAMKLARDIVALFRGL